MGGMGHLLQPLADRAARTVDQRHQRPHRISLGRFLALDVAGEVLWLVIYVSLGRAFSDQVQTIASLLGNLTWVIVGLLAAALLGWKLFGRSQAPTDDPA